MFLIWMPIEDGLPTTEGKYVVKTKTQMGNQRKVECNFTITNDKGSWSVTNQIVTHWLKES